MTAAEQDETLVALLADMAMTARDIQAFVQSAAPGQAAAAPELRQALCRLSGKCQVAAHRLGRVRHE